MRLMRIIKQLISSAKTTSVSPEFLAWRQQFFPGRIQLLAWIVLIVLILVTVLNLKVTIPGLNATGDPKLAFDADRLQAYLETAISQIVSVFLGLLITQSSWVRQTPIQVFLLFNALVIFPPQVTAALRGEVSFDGATWLIYFAVQAILIPVHWRLHIISQVVTLGYFAIAFSSGWRDPNVIVSAAYMLTGVYTVFICFVADMGVFLYERSRRRELELWQQLRVFIHAVSHDLRNPVLGMVMTLKSFLQPSGEAARIPQELLEQLIASGNRQVALINSLLEAHATELHGIPLHRQFVSLPQLLASIAADFQPFFQQTQTTLTQSLPTDFPCVYADPLHLRRVYENLISNALRYNRPGLHLTMDATIFNHNSQTWVRCTVSDNGVGMTSEQCDRLFTLYSRGRDQRRSLSLGLGLYMCQQIITAHGGEIGVISSPGNGATFWLTLPVAAQI